MSTEVTISLSVRELDGAIERMSTLLGMDSAEVVRDQFKSCLKTIIRYTPPSNKKQGEQRVEKDIRKIFVSPTSLFPRGSHIPKLDAALKASDWTKAVGIISKLSRFKYLTVADSPSESIHNKYKNARGRVERKQSPVVLIKNPEALASFITKIQGHVGLAKASWLAGAKKFGATSIVGYVTRHGVTDGSATDTMKDGTGYVEAVSQNPATESIEARLAIVDRALKNVERGLTIRLEKTLEKMEKQFNR